MSGGVPFCGGRRRSFRFTRAQTQKAPKIQKTLKALFQLQQLGGEAVVPRARRDPPQSVWGRPKGQPKGGKAQEFRAVGQDTGHDSVELEAVREGDVSPDFPKGRLGASRRLRSLERLGAVAEDVGRLLKTGPFVAAAASAPRPLGQRAQLGEAPHGAPAAQAALGRLRKEGQVEPRVVDDQALDLPALPEVHQLGPVLDEVRGRGDTLPQRQEPFGGEPMDAEEVGVVAY